MYVEYLEFNIETCFVFGLIAILGNIVKVPGLYKAIEEKFYKLHILYSSELSISFLLWYIMGIILSIGSNEGCRLCGTIWLIICLMFVFYICYLGNPMGSNINFINYLLLGVLVWFLLVLSYTNIFIVSNLAMQVSEIKGFEALVLGNEADLNPVQTCYMYGRSSSYLSKMGLRAFTAIHCLAGVKTPEILNPILYKTFFQEGGRLIGLKLNTLLPIVCGDIIPAAEIIKSAGSAEYKPDAGFHSIPYLSDSSGVKSVQQFILAKQGGCNFETMGLGELRPFFDENYLGKFEIDIRKMAAISLAKKMGPFFEQVCPADPDSMPGVKFLTIKYLGLNVKLAVLDGLQIQEILGAIGLKQDQGLQTILRTESDHQGDCSGMIRGQKIYCDFKMGESNLDYGVKSVNSNLKNALGIFESEFRPEKATFSNVPLFLPKVLVIDLSVFRFNSLEALKEHQLSVLLRLDPSLLQNVNIIESLDEAVSGKVNLLFSHEIEVLNKINYPFIFSDQAIQYQDFLNHVGDNYKEQELFIEYISKPRLDSYGPKASKMLGEVRQSLVDCIKKTRGNNVGW